MPQKLDNYLRTHRRRTGLTQEELAFLLGAKSSTKVSRYEHFVRKPAFPAVIACEVVFRVPARELFAGVYEREKRLTVRRVRVLIDRLHAAKPEPRTRYLLSGLERIVADGK